MSQAAGCQTGCHLRRARQGDHGDKLVADTNIQKSNCRFQASKAKDGKPTMTLELFHPTVSSLAGMTVEFELMGGTTFQEAKALAEAVNDRVIAIVLTQA